jgi:hypothetical protein
MTNRLRRSEMEDVQSILSFGSWEGVIRFDLALITALVLVA